MECYRTECGGRREGRWQIVFATVRIPTGTGISIGWVKLTCYRIQISDETVSENLATLMKYVFSMYDT
jgi:hypothetical protein